MEKVVRFGVWTVFGFGFVVLAAVAALTALAAKPAVAQAQKGVKSKITVTVPQDDAELQIEKKVMRTAGKVREFDTPDLEAKKMYEYEFVATWKPNNYTVITRTRVEKFVAGDAVVVDLTKEPKDGDPKDKMVIRFVPTPDDIVDAMIKLAENYADRPPAELAPLFQRILSNATMDYFRRQKVRNAVMMNMSDFEGASADEDFDLLEILESQDGALGGLSAADEVSRAQILQRIEAAVEDLPARQREAFLLRYWEELDVAETAAVMGCSEGSVKTHCSRATHALAKALKAKGITL